MYSSQLSDTYEYGYDDDDFDDSDDDKTIQNGLTSDGEKSSRNDGSLDRRKEQNSYRASVTSSGIASVNGSKSGTKNGIKSNSPLFEKNPEMESFFSEPIVPSPKTSASHSAYSAVHQSRNSGMSTKSTPHSTKSFYGNKGKKHRERNLQKQAVTNQSQNVVVKRVLSASRNKMHALQNLIMELQTQVDDLKLENRDLKRASRLQEKEIKRLDNEEADLPSLLQKHSNETRVLREKLRKQKETADRSNEEVRKKDLELLKLRDKLKKCEEIIQSKKLDERDKLNQKVEKLEEELDSKQQKILDLEKSIRLHEKLRNREMKEKNDKYKKVVDELIRMEKEFKEVQMKLREKERELEVKNIYTRSINIKMKQGVRRNSLELEDLNSPTLTRKSIRSTSPVDSIQVRGSLRDSNFLDTKSSNKTEVSKDVSVNSLESNRRSLDVETLVGEQRRKEQEQLKEKLKEKEEEIDRLDKEAKAREEILRREMESRLKRDKEELELRFRTEQAKKEEEFQTELEKIKRDEEGHFESDKKALSAFVDHLKSDEETEKRRLEEERERAEHELEEMERRKKEERELEEMEKRRREEEETNRKREELRKLEEKRTREVDGKLKGEEGREQEGVESQEAKRKRELLLAKMKAIDAGEDPDKVASGSEGYSPSVSVASEGSSQRKPVFLQKEIPNKKADEDVILKHAPLDFSSGQPNKDNRQGSGSRRGSGGKTYLFRNTDENMHQGLPAFHGSDDQLKPGSGRRRSQDDGLPRNFSQAVESRSSSLRDSAKSRRRGDHLTTAVDRESNGSQKGSSGDEPFYGRRAAPTVAAEQDDTVFGNYAPSFSSQRNSGGSVISQSTSNKANRSHVDDTANANNSNYVKQPRFGRRAAKETQGVNGRNGSSGADGLDSSFGINGFGEYKNESKVTDFDDRSNQKAHRATGNTNNGLFSPTGGAGTFTQNDKLRQTVPLKESVTEVIDDLEDVLHL